MIYNINGPDIYNYIASFLENTIMETNYKKSLPEVKEGFSCNAAAFLFMLRKRNKILATLIEK